MTHPALHDKAVAVVTGAAGGIGLAIARRLSDAGARVAMLDHDADLVTAAAADVAGALPFSCDVADLSAMEDTRDRIVAALGAPNILINNAATFVGRGLDAPIGDWRRLMEVNLWGVIHGVRTFLPGIQGPGLIVNTGSKQGITSPPGHAVYNMAKAALKTYTECLEHDLRQVEGRPVTAHLLIPGFTNRRGRDSASAWSGDQVAEHMMSAVSRGDFYILCQDNEVTLAMDHARIAWGAGDIIENRPPLSRWHPDWKDKYQDPT